MSMTYDYGDTKLAEEYCELAKKSGAEVTCFGTKVSIRNVETKDETSSSQKWVGGSKEDFIEAGEADGFVCE